MSFDAKKYTERLDKIAEEIEGISPELALQIDKVSDVLEGRKEASSLTFDADEARYMANRFNYDVRKRESDEPYMDDYNKSDFSQTSDAYAKMPGHSGAKKVEEKVEEKAEEVEEKAAAEEEKEEEKEEKTSSNRPYAKL